MKRANGGSLGRSSCSGIAGVANRYSQWSKMDRLTLVISTIPQDPIQWCELHRPCPLQSSSASQAFPPSLPIRFSPSPMPPPTSLLVHHDSQFSRPIDAWLLLFLFFSLPNHYPTPQYRGVTQYASDACEKPVEHEQLPSARKLDAGWKGIAQPLLQRGLERRGHLVFARLHVRTASRSAR